MQSEAAEEETPDAELVTEAQSLLDEYNAGAAGSSSSSGGGSVAAAKEVGSK